MALGTMFTTGGYRLGIPAVGGGEWLGNEPASMTFSAERTFDAADENGWWDFIPFSSFISDGTAPHSPSSCARSLFPEGYVAGSGPCATALVMDGFRTLYCCWYAKYSANWYGQDSGTNKQVYLVSNGDIPTLYFKAAGAGSNELEPFIEIQFSVSPAPGNYGPDLVPSTRIIRNQWHYYEIVAVGNTASTADGSFDFWLDGIHVMNIPNAQWKTGATTWIEFKHHPVWGGTGGPNVPADQTFDLDHAYASGKN